MNTVQFSLFGQEPATPRPRIERSPAKAARREFDRLRQQLARAQGDLADASYNLEMVMEHQRISREGRIDENWWEGAMRMGIWHFEEETEYRMGSYPIKVVRWLRHLNFTLHAERRDIQAVIDELTPKVAALAQLIDPAPAARA